MCKQHPKSKIGILSVVKMPVLSTFCKMRGSDPFTQCLEHAKVPTRCVCVEGSPGCCYSKGGGHLLRDTWAILGRNTRPTRGLDSLSGVTFGGARKRYDSLGGITFGNSKRNFDEIDRTGFNSFVKKNFDEIDRSGFDTFVKRNFDEIDRAGFDSFVKRSAPLYTQNPAN